jgi:hypothetical protein
MELKHICKVDLVVAGAYQKDFTKLLKSIYSVPFDFEFNQRYLLFDGIQEDKFIKCKQDYNYFKSVIKEDYPDYKIKEFDENIYFRKMIEWVCQDSNADYLFVIQDDVKVDQLNLDHIIVDMIGYQIGILSFPHKQIPPEGTHWFTPFNDTYPDKYIHSHGWSERVFITKREHMKDILETTPASSKITEKFIDTIYNQEMKKKDWKNKSHDEQIEHWNKWKCYLHYDILHKHLVAHR